MCKINEALQTGVWHKGLRPYEIYKKELCVANDILLRNNKIVPPIELRARLLKAGQEKFIQEEI